MLRFRLSLSLAPVPCFRILLNHRVLPREQCILLLPLYRFCEARVNPIIFESAM